MNKEENLRLYLANEAQTLITLKEYPFLHEGDIISILQWELQVSYTDVIHARLTTAQMVQHIRNYIERNGAVIGQISLDITENDIDWYPRNNDALEKATVRHNGHKWVIHQNDADPNPSVPHAHDYQENLKLDLYNGNLYLGNHLSGKLKTKELNAIKAKIKNDFPNIKFAS